MPVASAAPFSISAYLYLSLPISTFTYLYLYLSISVWLAAVWRLGLYVEAGLARPTASGLSKPVEPFVLVVHTYIIQLQTDRDPATVGNSPLAASVWASYMFTKKAS